MQGLNACVADRVKRRIEFIDGARRICFKVKSGLLDQRFVVGKAGNTLSTVRHTVDRIIRIHALGTGFPADDLRAQIIIQIVVQRQQAVLERDQRRAIHKAGNIRAVPGASRCLEVIHQLRIVIIRIDLDGHIGVQLTEAFDGL